MLGFCLVWTCTGHVCTVTVSGNLYVYQTCCVWKIHFMKILSGLFFVCSYILWCTPKIKNKLQNDNKTYLTYRFSLPSLSMLVKWKYFIEHMGPRIFFSHSFFGIMSFIFSSDFKWNQQGLSSQSWRSRTLGTHILSWEIYTWEVVAVVWQTS